MGTFSNAESELKRSHSDDGNGDGGNSKVPCT